MRAQTRRLLARHTGWRLGRPGRRVGSDRDGSQARAIPRVAAELRRRLAARAVLRSRGVAPGPIGSGARTNGRLRAGRRVTRGHGRRRRGRRPRGTRPVRLYAGGDRSLGFPRRHGGRRSRGDWPHSVGKRGVRQGWRTRSDRLSGSALVSQCGSGTLERQHRTRSAFRGIRWMSGAGV